MIYAGGTRSRLKFDKKEDSIKGLRMKKPAQSEIMSGCSTRYFHQRELKVC